MLCEILILHPRERFHLAAEISVERHQLDDIGERLRISQNTVKTHLKDIYRKLRVRSRNEAVVVAVRVGLLSLAEDRAGKPDGDQQAGMEDRP